MPRPTCIDCGASFTPTLHAQRRCLVHQERGRASRSPTTRAQDAEYRRNRALVLAGSPTCTLRTHCDGAPATTADHVVPVAVGGTNDLTNLRPACLSCNAARGARS